MPIPWPKTVRLENEFKICFKVFNFE
jgi:hypothetical protein